MMMRTVLAGAIACALGGTLAGCYWLLPEDKDIGASESGKEGGLDGEGPGDADAGPFCPADVGPLAYCMDFDGVDADVLGLGADKADAGIVTGTYVSFPNSLYLELSGVYSSANYIVGFPLQPTKVRLEFQVRTDEVVNSVSATSITLTQDSMERQLTLILSENNGFQLQEYFTLPDGGHPLPGDHDPYQFDGGGWHHVIMTLIVNDVMNEYDSSFTVDGQMLEDNRPLNFVWAQGAASVIIGASYALDPGSQLYYDNVRVDLTP